MKTIEVSDAMYDFLMSLSKELNTQDNRGTAMPYFFQIETKEKVYTPEGCGTECYVNDDSEIETDEEIKEAIAGIRGIDVVDFEKYFTELDGGEQEDILLRNGWRKVNYQMVDKYQNAFFTAKACKEHIAQNNYHYNEPVDYLSHAFRNPEMKLVLKFLTELTGGSLHK